MGQLNFQPQYIVQTELATFGLPDPTFQSNIMNLVEMASTLIDEYCGRVDGDGNGSLVYTTYSERMLLPEGRNIFRTMFKPLVAVSATYQATLVAADAASGHIYNGFQPNTVLLGDNVTLSPVISASGRYGYSRRASQQVYPDLNYGANLLQIASFFGGPPQFTPIDVTKIDFDTKTGEIWVPAGLYLSQYTEVVVTYNSGFDPLNIPKPIKHACAAVVKNSLSRAGGTTGLTGLSAGRVSGQFTESLIDTTIDRMLTPYKVVIAY